MDIRRKVKEDSRITEFQRRVYLALLEVPRGATISYRELGERIGCRSAQAIGQALKRNPFAPDVPCHRVIASDGSIGGFHGQRGGEMIEKKRRRLQEEFYSPQKNMIKNLIFDFGKVLVDYDFEAFFRKYIPDAQRYQALTPVLYNEEIQQILDREEEPLEDIIGKLIQEHPGYEREILTFSERFPEIVTGEMPGMRELLIRLKSEGYKLYGLTNWNSKVHLTMAQYPIFRLLDGQIISSEEKVIKPEPEIYRRLFERFNIKPEECIFADDRAVNIEGGRRMGMPGIVFHDARQYEEELRSLVG